MRREKRMALLLAGVLTLAGCAAPAAETPTPATPSPVPTGAETLAPTPSPTPEPTPGEVTELWGFPIDDTHDAFEVPTGGRLGTLLVTVEIGEEKFEFSVWETDNLETPIQRMTAEGTTAVHWHDVVDADFDGYTDFGYTRLAAPRTMYFNYWLWDEDNGQFVIEPQLEWIPEPQFSSAEKVVAGMDTTLNFGSLSIYRWEGTDLLCVRELTASRVLDEKGTWLDRCEWSVKDRIENEMVEIYHEIVHAPEDSFLMDGIAEKWYDLDYHGE